MAAYFMNEYQPRLLGNFSSTRCRAGFPDAGLFKRPPRYAHVCLRAAGLGIGAQSRSLATTDNINGDVTHSEFVFGPYPYIRGIRGRGFAKTPAGGGCAAAAPMGRSGAG